MNTGEYSINQQIFKKESTIGIRAILFIIIALSLMFTDHNNETFHKWRSTASIIVMPIQYLVSFPINTINKMIDDFSTKENLIRENAALKAKVSLLNAKLQRQFVLKSENKRLRALLQSSAYVEDKVTVAQLLSVSIDPFVHQIILNRGRYHKLFVGQPVLDAYGIMGQIVQVGPLTSRMMLITDSQSAIPVQIKRNGIRAIAVGHSISNVLKLQNITETTDIKIGDKLITSGLGQRYPFGYPVGIVVSVEHDPSKTFADITIKPAAHLDRSRLVLLVWPKQSEYDKLV